MGMARRQLHQRRQWQWHQHCWCVNGLIDINVIHFHGNFAVDGDGTFAVPCKRTLSQIRIYEVESPEYSAWRTIVRMTVVDTEETL